MGRRVKLTESLLHRMINETVKEVINEATWKKSIDNKWAQAEQIMGAESMLNALYSFLDGDTIEEFIEVLEREYEIPFENDDEYEEDYEF